jgi:predicted O-methyltransferase YrrM
MSRFFSGIEFVRFYFRARNMYRLHSPLMYQIAKYVLDAHENHLVFNRIESIRKTLRSNKNPLGITSHGAGSRISRKKLRIKDEVKRSSIPKYQGRWLFHLVRLFEPDRILELGTSFGISTMYLHLARPETKMITVEGNPKVAEIASSLSRDLRSSTLIYKVGTFSEQIPGSLEELEYVDLVFLDGDHRYTETIDYFEMILPYISRKGIFILDDIYWSAGMKRAWKELQQHPSVSVSVDLFYKGLLFFKEMHLEKINNILIPFWWKPFPF